MAAGRQSQSKEKRPSEYVREALSQWAKAARYSGRALSPAIKDAATALRPGGEEGPSLLERLDPSSTDKGGRLGDAADFVLGKVGGPAGKLVSRFSGGSRIVERMRSRNTGDQDNGSPASDASDTDSGSTGFRGRLPVPIQESIEVAVPVGVAYRLFMRFEDYPRFLDRVESAERVTRGRVFVAAKIRGHRRELIVQIADERPNERVDWQCGDEIEHSGVVSFHELAPRLTHIELTVELEPSGVVERLTRSAGLTGRAIRADLHRFKAYAELFEDDEEVGEGEEELETDEVEGEADLDAEDFEDEGLGDEDEYEEDEVDEDEDDVTDVEDEYEDDEDFEDEEEL